MSFTRDAGELLDRLVLVSPQQRFLRVVTFLGAVLFVVLVPAAGGEFRPVPTAFALMLGVASALLPESHAPLGLLLALGGLWAWVVPRDLDGWLLLATADLAAVHVACTLASYGPVGTVLDRTLLTLWVRRYAACLAVAGAVWLVARALDFLDLPGSEPALGAALGVVLVWLAYLTVRLARRDSPRV